jgi:uncharacterized membrane protein HdeD (DUF308 family)
MVGAPSETSDEEDGEMDEQQSATVVVVNERAVSHRYWGVMLAAGIVAVIFGIIVLANIWGSVRLVAVLAGLFLVFAGIMQLVHAAGAERKTGKIIGGLVILILGLVLVFWPESSVKTVAVLIGLAFLFWGVVMAIAAFVDRGEGWGIAAGFGLLLALVGIIVVAWPGPTIAILMILVGLDAILFGASLIAQSLALRKA